MIDVIIYQDSFYSNNCNCYITVFQTCKKTFNNDLGFMEFKKVIKHWDGFFICSPNGFYPESCEFNIKEIDGRYDGDIFITNPIPKRAKTGGHVSYKFKFKGNGPLKFKGVVIDAMDQKTTN